MCLFCQFRNVCTSIVIIWRKIASCFDIWLIHICPLVTFMNLYRLVNDINSCWDSSCLINDTVFLDNKLGQLHEVMGVSLDSCHYNKALFSFAFLLLEWCFLQISTWLHATLLFFYPFSLFQCPPANWTPTVFVLCSVCLLSNGFFFFLQWLFF